MTIDEKNKIDELTMRLFGEDGQGGSLGRIEVLLTGADRRIEILEADKIARDAREAVTLHMAADAQTSRRWRTTAVVTTLAAAVASTVGIVNVIINVSH